VVTLGPVGFADGLVARLARFVNGTRYCEAAGEAQARLVGLHTRQVAGIWWDGEPQGLCKTRKVPFEQGFDLSQRDWSASIGAMVAEQKLRAGRARLPCWGRGRVLQ
jgi:hypothetical protein